MYYIYGKYQGQKKFRPMDINVGVQVDNLIRATRLTEEQKNKFMAVEAPRNSPKWEFEARSIK